MHQLVLSVNGIMRVLVSYTQAKWDLRMYVVLSVVRLHFFPQEGWTLAEAHK